MPSILLELDPSSIDKIVEILPYYDQKVAEAEAIFKLEGRKIEEIARTLPQHQAQYEKMLADLKGIESWISIHKERVTAKLWKNYNEGYSRALSARDIQAYIEGEKSIVEINQISTAVTITKSHVNAIVEGLRQMAFMLSNITKLRVAELEHSIL